MTKARSLVESALLTGLSVVLFVGTEIPIVGALLMLLCPVPLVVLEMRHDLRYGVTSLAVGSILVMLFSGPMMALSYAFGFAILALAMGRIIELRRSAVDILFFSSMVALACELALAVSMFFITGVNSINLDAESMNKIVDTLAPYLGSNPETMALLKSQLSLLPLLIPAMFVMTAALNSYITYFASGLVLKKVSRIDLPKLPSFSCWRFPQSVLWAYMASILCLIGMNWWPAQAELLKRIGLNLKTIVDVLLLFQGLSFFYWFLEKKGVGRKLRVFLMFVAAFFPALSPLVIYAGLFDMCWNFRERFNRR